MWLSTVVLPTPRKNERIVTRSLFVCLIDSLPFHYAASLFAVGEDFMQISTLSSNITYRQILDAFALR